MITKRVKITEEESTNLESMWYKYNADKDILSTLLQSKINVISGPGKEIYDLVGLEFKHLEKAKTEIALKYNPFTDYNVNELNYSFLFDTCEIEYSV